MSFEVGSSPTLRVRVYPDGRDSTISLTGEVDVDTAGYLDDAFSIAMAGSPDVVRIDLRDVSFMDSTGVHALLTARKRCQEEGCRLILTLGSPGPRKVLELTGVVGLFEVSAPEATAG